MADLLIPIIIILAMYILIDALDNILPLFMISLFFLPLSWLFVYQLNGGVYTTMFNGDISAYTANIPNFNILLSLFIFSIPIIGIYKTIGLKNLINKKDLEDKNIDEE